MPRHKTKRHTAPRRKVFSPTTKLKPRTPHGAPKPNKPSGNEPPPTF